MNKTIPIAGIIGIALIAGVVFFIRQRQVQFQTPLEEVMEPLATDVPTATPSDWADIADITNSITSFGYSLAEVDPDMHDSLRDSQLDEPFLVYDVNHQPIYWKFLFRKDGYVIGHADADVKSGELLRYGVFGKPLKYYPDPPTAEEALDQAQDILSQYTDATIDSPFFHGPDRESWLILVHRDDEVIDRIGVWGDEAWHEPAEWDGIYR